MHFTRSRPTERLRLSLRRCERSDPLRPSSAPRFGDEIREITSAAQIGALARVGTHHSEADLGQPVVHGTESRHCAR
jgi:hypothetical protein